MSAAEDQRHRFYSSLVNAISIQCQTDATLSEQFSENEMELLIVKTRYVFGAFELRQKQLRVTVDKFADSFLTQNKTIFKTKLNNYWVYFGTLVGTCKLQNCAVLIIPNISVQLTKRFAPSEPFTQPPRPFYSLSL